MYFDKSVTSKDVAKLAGVSQPTVSRVFNRSEKYRVKDDVQQRVLEAAKELGYRPNLVARGMISGKTNIVALVVGDSLGPFYNKIINMFIARVQELGKQCLVFKVPRQGRMEPIIERVIQFQVEAVIITASAMTKVMAETIVHNHIPVILFNRYIPGIDSNIVYVDTVEGSKKVADFFGKQKHKRVGCIHFSQETAEELDKKNGFYERLKYYGIDVICAEESGYDYQEGYEAGRRILTTENPPTAIFCTSDLIALGVMDVARREFGIAIPEELEIIGYDDIEMARWDSYSLTTVRQPLDDMVDAVMKVLKQCLVEGNNKPQVVQVESKLIERNSTRKHE